MNPNATAYTRRARQMPQYGCCKQGSACVCSSEAADSGTTLAQEIAMQQAEEAEAFLAGAEEMQRRAQPLVWTILTALVAVLAFFATR